MRRIILMALLLALGWAAMSAQNPPPLTSCGFPNSDADKLCANVVNGIAAMSAMQEARLAAIENELKVLQAAQAPHITEYTIETATGNAGAWALTSTESEMFGTRRLVSFQNVKQFRLCFNLGAGGGPGASIHLDESYDWTITSAEGTWMQILGPIDISAWRVACTPWTPYTGNQVDAFVRIRGSSPNPAAAQFMNIALEVQ